MMAWTDGIKGRIKPLPSPLYDNMCIVGPNVAYASHKTVIMVNLATAQGKETEIRKIEAQDGGRVFSIRTCYVKDMPLVVMTTDIGLQVWDHNATHLLYTWKLPASQDTAHVSIGYFARGVAVNAAQDGTVQLCVGSSTGAIYIFAVDAMGRVRPATSLQYNGSPIVALGSACQSRGGSGQEGGGDDETAMVSSGEDGSVVVWEAASSSSYKARGAIDGGSQPCTSIAVRKGLLICARLNGVVQMYDLASLTLRAELVAHSRLLTCMDIHPRKDIIVTASEDCTVHVWQLPLAPSDKVAVLMSVCWLHAPMWGVAFCGPERDDIAAVGYDTDEIQVWRAKPA